MSHKDLKKITVFVMSFLAISMAYQNCGSPSGSASSSSVAASNNGDIVAIPNTKTASIQRSSRIVDNLVSCLGTVTASKNALAAWKDNKGSISEEGLANSMTQPMAKALVSISAEVCNDLIFKEKDQPANEKKIFVEMNLNSGGLSDADLVIAAKRIARSCWGRNASQEELDAIVSSTDSAFSGAKDDVNLTRNKVLFMCTAMAASFDAINM